MHREYIRYTCGLSVITIKYIRLFIHVDNHAVTDKLHACVVSGPSDISPQTRCAAIAWLFTTINRHIYSIVITDKLHLYPMDQKFVF